MNNTNQAHLQAPIPPGGHPQNTLANFNDIGNVPNIMNHRVGYLPMTDALKQSQTGKDYNEWAEKNRRDKIVALFDAGMLIKKPWWWFW